MNSAALVREGRVLAHDGHVAQLQISTPCQSCQSRCLLGSFGDTPVQIAKPAGLQLARGEHVRISISRTEFTRVCAVLFGVPFFAWVAGALLGDHLWGEPGAALLALVTLLCALCGLALRRGSLRRWVKLELIPAQRGSVMWN
jgi:positive regulator of sigma E activity